MTSLKPMPYLKGYPDQLPIALVCLLAVQDTLPESERWARLVECLYSKLPLVAGSTNVNVENSTHAQILPTLRKLGLVTDVGPATRLTTRGWAVAKQSRDPKQLKLNLAAVLLDRDNDTWGFIPIVDRLRSYPGEPVNIYDLAIGLAKRGMDPHQVFRGAPQEKLAELRRLGATVDGGSRLTETLKFYNFTDILRRADGTVTLLDSTVERGRAAFDAMIRRKVTVDEFFPVLKNAYDSLSRRARSPYVPLIPYIREAVCRELRLDEEQFNSLLNQAVPTYGDFLLLLSPPPGRMSPKNLFPGRAGQFYYLSMYPKGGQDMSQ